MHQLYICSLFSSKLRSQDPQTNSILEKFSFFLSAIWALWLLSFMTEGKKNRHAGLKLLLVVILMENIILIVL